MDFAIWGIEFLIIILWLIVDLLRGTLFRPKNFALVLYFIMPMLMMVPFSFSFKNAETIGSTNYTAYFPFIKNALEITILGTGVFLISYFVFSRFKINLKFKRLSNGIINITYGPIRFFLYVAMILLYIYLVINSKEAIINGQGIRGGSNSGLQQLLYNIFSSIFPLLFYTVLIRYRNSKFLYIYMILLFGVGISTGSRTLAFMPIIYFILAKVASQKQENIKNNMKLILIFILVIIIMMFLGTIRSTNHLSGNQTIVDSIFYGNTFSDFRDTAWILSGMNCCFAHGKTYMAALLSFIPSNIFPFRALWSLGAFTNRMANITSESHPGLRPIIFGEAYFNFSFVGVIAIAIIFAYIVISLDKFKAKVRIEKNILLVGFSFILLQMFHYLMITAGFFTFYIQIVFIIFCSFIQFKIERK